MSSNEVIVSLHKEVHKEEHEKEGEEEEEFVKAD